MDIKRAKKIVLKANPGHRIVKSYDGYLSGDHVFGFIITKEGVINRFLIIYEDKQIREPTGPMATFTLNSLNEIE